MDKTKESSNVLSLQQRIERGKQENDWQYWCWLLRDKHEELSLTDGKEICDFAGDWRVTVTFIDLKGAELSENQLRNLGRQAQNPHVWRQINKVRGESFPFRLTGVK